ncbi:3-methyl-2-oxobutanoate hydroxymethyltransferase [Corynebacterium sp. zg-331]|uniref:3-methyl-2-oxobutanoate hydroxymethyltransferase n=1 Tax=unclassified Corynebacterium TaxID=2624378 RepID=UPI00128CB19B|nr:MULTISPECIES: 3-methyl-2-oxobutanoate hydroxymethyltransferase [unclassified Corynebacterium]MBC3186666.1 3-methyl-2-oxobutanoate hydroxymethyltransferase [Corynebacterium sp. zg-331]MPV53150.1 3-methyl-2-oxobutanoate hydroxymethyltransferase [Corynebacterium sp. zg331]
MAQITHGRVRTRHLLQAKQQGRRITALTSYDALTARIFDDAGIDLLLVGDSAANVVLGHPSTLPITVDELVSLARAVTGAATRAFVVADLPFGSYEAGPEQALATATRFMKEAGVAAVKLEGGTEIAPTIAALVRAGIPVVGHLGYTPQSEHALGGHVVQGRGAGAQRLREDALAVQEAGACAVVFEMVPAATAGQISKQLSIPTIGIGAGAGTDGQILVWTDAFGLTRGTTPRFVRAYAHLGEELGRATRAYIQDVQAGDFPGAAESFGEE